MEKAKPLIHLDKMTIPRWNSQYEYWLRPSSNYKDKFQKSLIAFHCQPFILQNQDRFSNLTLCQKKLASSQLNWVHSHCLLCIGRRRHDTPEDGKFSIGGSFHGYLYLISKQNNNSRFFQIKLFSLIFQHFHKWRYLYSF